MYHLSFFENNRFICFLGGEIHSLPEAIKNLEQVKNIIGNPQLISNTAVKYDRNGTICAIIITDQWNEPIYEAKFQYDAALDEPINEISNE